MLKVDAGGGVWVAVLQPGIDAVAAGYGVVTLLKEMDVMLAEMLAVFAGWVVHCITSQTL